MVTNKQLESWNKMKGHNVSDITRKKISETTKKLIIEGKKSRFNLGSFKKGQTPWNKGKIFPQFRRENAANWIGGTRKTARRMAIEDYKMDLSRCQICGDTKKIIHIHHHNGNINDNKRQNLGVVCSYCHNAIHDNPNRRANRFKKGHLPYTNLMP